jgi:hypothetical protein
MRMLRWLLAAAVTAYAAAGVLPTLETVLYKLRLPTPGVGARMIPLLVATPWWQIAAGLAVAGLLLAAAWRLGRGHMVFGLSLFAFALDTLLWWVVHAMPAYQLAYTPAELGDDYLTLAGMMALLLAIWIIERTQSGRAAA